MGRETMHCQIPWKTIFRLYSTEHIYASWAADIEVLDKAFLCISAIFVDKFLDTEINVWHFNVLF